MRKGTDGSAAQANTRKAAMSASGDEIKDESARAVRSGRSARHIARPLSLPPVEIESDHGGEGPISFRRLFVSDDWEGPIDFVDYTVVPPGSSIGFHSHEGNDEIYLVVSGQATMSVDGQEHRVQASDVIVTPSGSAHGLRNDGKEPFVMFVVQVGHGAP
jgi:mannose-6-phosphate isomerase-like protein (cupin superfamily)